MNVNIFAVSTSLVQLGGGVCDCRLERVEFVATTRQGRIIDSGGWHINPEKLSKLPHDIKSFLV